MVTQHMLESCYEVRLLTYQRWDHEPVIGSETCLLSRPCPETKAHDDGRNSGKDRSRGYDLSVISIGKSRIVGRLRGGHDDCLEDLRDSWEVEKLNIPPRTRATEVKKKGGCPSRISGFVMERKRGGRPDPGRDPVH